VDCLPLPEKEIRMTENTSPNKKGSSGWLPGTLLIIAGVLALVNRYVNWSFDTGLLVLPGIGLAFLIAGLVSRKSGLFVPAGILTCLGAGIILIDGPFAAMSDETQSGIVLAALGSGFIVAMLLSLLGDERPFYWALIPGCILGALGAGFVVFDQFPQFMTNWGTMLLGGLLVLVGIVVLIHGLTRRE